MTASAGMGTTYQSIFGTVVAELRNSRDPAITQSDLAQHMGLAVSTWSRIERGESALTLEQMVRVSTFLGVPLSDIFKACEIVLGKLQEQGITVAVTREALSETKGVVTLSNGQLLALLAPFGLLVGPVGSVIVAGLAASIKQDWYRALKDKLKTK